MNHMLLIVLAVLCALVALVGVYLTLVAFDKSIQDKDAPKWLDDHLDVLKWLGPCVIGVGVVGLVLSCCVLKRVPGKLGSRRKSRS